MRKNRYVLKGLIVGILVAQAVSTFHVHGSNLDLDRTLTAVGREGYLAVPTHHLQPGLRSFCSAFWGGLFFTLSTGLTITLLAIFAAWTWDRIFHRKKRGLVFLCALWAGCMVSANSQGFCAVATSLFFFIPLIVFGACIRWMPREKGGKPYVVVSFSFVLAALAGILFFNADSGIFIGIRDGLLLTNRPGTKINAFYYRYTMYPAEVFKSLDQKLIKTCRLVSFGDNQVLAGRLQQALEKQDYLRLTGPGAVDLTVEKTEKVLILANNGKALVRTTPEDFLRNPKKNLTQFSEKCDPHAFLRSFTFFSLFFLLPLAFYGILFAPLRFLTGRFLHPVPSFILTSTVCLLLGAVLLFILLPQKKSFSSEAALAKALNSGSLLIRTCALKHVDNQRIDVSRFFSYRRILTSPFAAERYWLARALGRSRSPAAYEDLLSLLDDPEPNVVCMACRTLGMKKERRAVQAIEKRLRTSDHWYIQWYAYKALKDLGWKQTKSRQNLLLSPSPL